MKFWRAIAMLLACLASGTLFAANPTTNKPSSTLYFMQPVVTGGTAGELMRVSDAVSTPVPYCPISDILGESFEGYSGNLRGRTPTLLTNVSFGDVTNQHALKYGVGTMGRRYRARGISGTITFPVTFMAQLYIESGATNISTITPILVSEGGGGSFGMGIRIGTTGTIDFGTTQNGQFSDSGLDLPRDKWLALAATYTGATTRTFNAYNSTDQAYISNSTLGTLTTGAGTPPPSTIGDLIFNPSISGATEYATRSFIGRCYHFGLSTANWTPGVTTYFADYLADPAIANRGGAYSDSGSALVAAGITVQDISATNVRIAVGHCTLGTQSALQYRLHISDTSGFTPSVDTRVGSLQSAPYWDYAPPNEQFAVGEITDGTTTVYTTATSTKEHSQVNLGPAKQDFNGVIIGDSRQLDSVGALIGKALAEKGLRAGCFTSSQGSSSYYFATSIPETSWQPASVQATAILLPKTIISINDAGNVTDAILLIGGNNAITGTPAETLSPYIDNVVNELLATSINRVWIVHVFMAVPTSGSANIAGITKIQEYRAMIDAKDNGSNVFAIGNNADYRGHAANFIYTNGDGIHYPTKPDAIAIADEIYSRLYPSNGGSGGYIFTAE